MSYDAIFRHVWDNSPEYICTLVGGAIVLAAQSIRKLVTRKRITADIYVTYSAKKTQEPGQPILKSGFLIIRNPTDKEIVARQIVTEASYWHRLFGASVLKKFQTDRELMRVPAGKGMQLEFAWIPQAWIPTTARFLGVRIGGIHGRTVWTRRRRWKKFLREYTRDFPGGSTDEKPEPLRFQEYGGSEQVSGEDKGGEDANGGESTDPKG